MKKDTRLFFETLIITCICIILFVGVGYFYLNKNLLETDTNPTESVPYYEVKPENKGIMFDVLGDKIFIFLNFEEEKICSCLNFEEGDFTDNQIYGYPIDFKVECDLEFIVDLVDYLGGIELEIEEEILRHTGVQIEEMILNEKSYKTEIFKAIIKQIGIKGLGNDLLLEMVENCKTNLTVPDFYYWRDYIKDMAVNLLIIDA